MTLFLALAGVLLLLSILVVLWPLWRRRQELAGSRREASIAIYRQHAAEIEQEVDAGRISQAQAQARRNELGARLLADVDVSEQGTTTANAAGAPRPWLSSAIVIAAFVVLSLGLYATIGDVRGLQPHQRPDIAEAVAKMEQQLREDPDDLRTRALLAQVQMAQRQYDDATTNLAAINKRLAEPDVQILLAEARARVLGNNGVVTERAAAIYDQVLALAPDEPEALWFAGLADLRAGKRERAAQHWQKLLQQDITPSFRDQVEQRLQELGVAPYAALPGDDA